MPNIITHYICGQEVIKKLQSSKLLKILNENEKAFNIGTQGPDILFYHNPLPWHKNKIINNLGDEIHDNPPKNNSIKNIPEAQKSYDDCDSQVTNQV